MAICYSTLSTYSVVTLDVLTPLLTVLQTFYSSIILVIMETVDIYGVFLIIFLFTNFTTTYLNFLFQIFLNSAGTQQLSTLPGFKPTALNNVNRLVTVNFTHYVFKKGLSSITNCFRKRVF